MILNDIHPTIEFLIGNLIMWGSIIFSLLIAKITNVTIQNYAIPLLFGFACGAVLLIHWIIREDVEYKTLAQTNNGVEK